MLRFLQKKDGTKILQQQCPVKHYAWEDVPLVEEKESASSRLVRAISLEKVRGVVLIILTSNKFYDELFEENTKTLYRPVQDKISSFYGHRLYKTDMVSDFKIVKEV